jgi:hypothetical protein
VRDSVLRYDESLRYAQSNVRRNSGPHELFSCEARLSAHQRPRPAVSGLGGTIDSSFSGLTPNPCYTPSAPILESAAIEPKLEWAPEDRQDQTLRGRIRSRY